MTRLAVALLLLGCGSRQPEVSAETPAERPARTMRLIAKDPRGAAGLIIAIRDGGGSWRELEASGDLSFPITAQRYSVAWACRTRLTLVYIEYLRIEDDPVEVVPCEVAEYGTVRGKVTGLVGTAARISARLPGAPVQPDGSYRVATEPGTRDLVVLDGDGDHRAWTTRRMKIVRGIEVPDVTTTVEHDVDLATDAIDLAHIEQEIDGLPENETGEVTVLLRSEHGALVFLSRDRTPPLVADLPPEGALPAGDEVEVMVSADSDGATRSAHRDGARWILDPELGMVEASLVQGSPPRVLLSWPRYPSTTSYIAQVMQLSSCSRTGCELVTWVGRISAAYAEGSAWVSFETPDFDLPAMAPFALLPDEEIRWSVRASVAAPDAGTSLGAGRDGTIAP